MSYSRTATTRFAALIHDALRHELEAQAESGGQIHLESVRSLFRRWEFQPNEVHELFKQIAMKLQRDLGPSQPSLLLRASPISNGEKNVPSNTLQLFCSDDTG